MNKSIEASKAVSSLPLERALTMSEEEENSSSADGTVVLLNNELLTAREDRKRNTMSMVLKQ